MGENDIHITVTPGTRLVITVAATGDGTLAAEPTPPPVGEGDVGLAAALSRLEKSGSPHVREAADGLAALGYELMAPKVLVDGKRAENYLRFHDPARPGAAIGYLTPQNISFTRDRARLADKPGGRVIPSTGEVAFPHAAGAARGLEIAKELKG